MTKDEGLLREIAERIWNDVYHGEHVMGQQGKTCFINMVSAGLKSGLHAYSLAMAANQAGNIDDLYVIFQEPRIE